EHMLSFDGSVSSIPIPGAFASPEAQFAPMPLLLEWFTSAPWLFYVIGVTLLLALLLWIGHARLAKLWPPQASSR
ncbi:MAG: hypothetical protein M3R04_06880, partial [bacterium]|nr:hypothetical protein [bacterium]